MRLGGANNSIPGHEGAIYENVFEVEVMGGPIGLRFEPIGKAKALPPSGL